MKDISTIQLLNSEEGFEVEFKRNAKNLNGEDFVSFANSKTGGTILIGVDESTNELGHQIGKVVGTNVSDEAKVSLQNKASSCSPKIDIEITKEEIDGLWIFRVFIPSGMKKPYCTSGGTYKIRKDGNKDSLFPSELLRIFLEQEQDSFLKRFQEASKNLESKLDEIDSSIGDTAKLVHTVGSDLEKIIKGK